MQAWTIFAEAVKTIHDKDLNIDGFWVKITPGILALVCGISMHVC